jgi:hypothetical protein
LAVTLRVSSFDNGPDSVDHEGTWLLGHTRQITFGELSRRGTELMVEAVLHVRCRHLARGPAGEGCCRAHGFRGPVPTPTAGDRAPRRLGGDRFRLLQHAEVADLELPLPKSGLPVLEGPNPCASAPCKTAEHTRGAACCRDLQIDILCPPGETMLEALIRSRLSPYLCKIKRDGELIEAEIVSACDYLDDAGRNCTLHGRLRPDGRTAKPDLCSDWPPKGKGLHPGCVFK